MELRLLRASLLVAALLAVTGWGAFYVQRNRTVSPIERVVYQDRVEYRDRVVNRDIVKTVTKPDGTKVVTQTKESSTTKTEQRETVKSNSSASPLPRYSLGLAVERTTSLTLREPLDYRGELGYRLTEHIWTTTSIAVDEKFKPLRVSVGLSFAF